MEIKKTTFKNILSFGGDKTYTITHDRGILTQINGENGVGKSNIRKIIELTLYSNYPSVLAKVVNDTSKSGFVTHEIASKGHQFEITYEFTKTALKKVTVKKNGKVEDYGSVTKTKEEIATNIVDIPEKIFSSIFCAAIDGSSTLLQMSAKEGRDITNHVFDLSDLNRVSKMVSDDQSLSNKRYDKSITVLETYETIVSELKISLSKENTENKIEKEQNIKDAKELIDSYNSNTKVLDREIENLETDSARIKDKLESLGKNNLREEKKGLNSEVDCLATEILSEKDREKGLIDVVSSYQAKEFKRVFDEAVEQRKDQRDHLAFKKTSFSVCDKSVEYLTEEIDAKEKHDEFIERLRFVISTKASMFEYSTEHKNLTTKKEELSLFNVSLTQIRDSIVSDIEKMRIKLEAYSKDNCVICGVDFDSAEYDGIRKSLNKEIDTAVELHKESLKDIADNYKESSLIDLESIKAKIAECVNSIKTTSKANPHGIKEENIAFNTLVEDDIDNYRNFNVTTSDKNSNNKNKLILEKIALEVLNKDVATIENKIEQLNIKVYNSLDEAQEKFGINLTTYKVVNYEIILSQVKELLKQCQEVLQVKELSKSQKLVRIGVIDSLISGYDFSINSKPSESLEDLQKLLTLKTDAVDSASIRLIEYKEKLLKESTTLSNLEAPSKKSSLAQQLESKKLQLVEKINERNLSLKEYNNFEVLRHLYNNGYLKNHLLSKVVEGINNLIAKIVTKHSIRVRVEFDSDFKSHLFKDGEPILYEQTSTGQRKILELLSIIGLVNYYYQSYPDISYIYLDEMLSTLSNNNKHVIIGLIQEELMGKLNMSVYVSSHTYVAATAIDRTLELTEKGLFTEIEING